MNMIRAIDVAITQIGVAEATGRNDGIPAQRYMKGNKLAWCAGFVAYCFDVSDDPDIAENVREFWAWGTNVQSLEDKMKERGQWFGWAITPQRNDIIFFANRGRSDPGRGRHCGIVEKVEGAWVHTIEGNLGNACKRAKHKLSSNRISGYARLADL